MEKTPEPSEGTEGSGGLIWHKRKLSFLCLTDSLVNLSHLQQINDHCSDVPLSLTGNLNRDLLLSHINHWHHHIARTRSSGKPDFPNLLETWVSQWGHSVLWPYDCLSVYLAQTLVTTQLFMSKNHRPDPNAKQRAESWCPPKSHDSFKIKVQLFRTWFGLWATCTHG